MFSINYVNPAERLEYDQRHAGPGATELTDALDCRTMAVKDIRDSDRHFSLQKHGFQPVLTPFNFDRFEDDKAIRNELYPQVVAFMKQELGADEVIVFDHTYRSSHRKEKTSHNRAPVKTVHNDYTDKSGQLRLLEETRYRPEWRQRRYQLINLWMPLHHVVKGSPLAMVDINSVKAEDFHRLTLIYPDRIGEIAAISHNPGHEWYYMSDMKPGEALLFKVFDPQLPKGVFGVPHSAVEPIYGAPGRSQPIEVNADNIPIGTRTSLEVRVIALFGELQ